MIVDDGHPFRSTIGPSSYIVAGAEDRITLADLAEDLERTNQLLEAINDKLDILIGIDTPEEP